MRKCEKSSASQGCEVTRPRRDRDVHDRHYLPGASHSKNEVMFLLPLRVPEPMCTETQYTFTFQLCGQWRSERQSCILAGLSLRGQRAIYRALIYPYSTFLANLFYCRGSRAYCSTISRLVFLLPIMFTFAGGVQFNGSPDMAIDYRRSSGGDVFISVSVCASADDALYDCHWDIRDSVVIYVC